MFDIFRLLKIARLKEASDVHLVVESPPLLRIHGSLNPLPDTLPLLAEDIESGFNQLTSEAQQKVFSKELELDFGCSVPDVGRIRCNAAHQRGTISMVIRLLPPVVMTLEELGLPEVCKELVTRPRGLVIVSGPTGSGKSTTLAAMINYLNGSDNSRVVTIEDPIEYVYTNYRSTITQREIGTDTFTFAEALRRVLRQDPDVILIGEMRDTETAAAALTIAETGHLVLTTGHAPSSSQAVERVVDLFPPHERALAQTRIASLILAVLCQALVPKVGGKGRVAAIEIMLGTPAVKNLIREGKIHQLPNVIRTSAKLGMRLLDQSLVHLYREGSITYDNVMGYCNDPEEIAKVLNMANDKLNALNLD